MGQRDALKMAYAKRSLKKKTTKKRSTMKRKAPKAKVTSRGRSQNSAPHRQTGYARALMDPKDGPLVGVPQFVPIDTHRVRTRAIGVVNSTSGSARIFFNPARMVANNSSAIKVWNHTGTVKWTGVTNDASGDSLTFSSNAPYDASEFQNTNLSTPDAINNGDGVKARVVGAMIRVCNVSSVQTRGGVFTALHEPHHKTLEDFDLSALSKNSKSIIRPAGDGGYISLLYRPVKPEEVEEWQINAEVVPGRKSVTTGALDGTSMDAYPGYMAIDFQGEQNTTLHVEAYAIIEYAGETVTTLSRPIGAGGGKPATPDDARRGAKDADKTEQAQVYFGASR